ncbi:hypothetical protein [Pseudoalteromonas prydzensis]|nr:hypothetical protein [Pseudoalteromonas prydzensis]
MSLSLALSQLPSHVYSLCQPMRELKFNFASLGLNDQLGWIIRNNTYTLI